MGLDAGVDDVLCSSESALLLLLLSRFCFQTLLLFPSDLSRCLTPVSPNTRWRSVSVGRKWLTRAFVFFRRAWKVCKTTAGHLSQGINSVSWGCLWRLLVRGVWGLTWERWQIRHSYLSLPAYLAVFHSTPHHTAAKTEWWMWYWEDVWIIIGHDA